MVIKKYMTFLDTGLCLLLILVGLICQQFDIGLASLFFILAFIVGGYQSAKEGIVELLFEKHLNVDILMVLAAIGAGFIGYWMEGALLIFIFSLSSGLEEMAMEKSRTAIAQLMTLRPTTARKLFSDDHIEEIATSDLVVGDRLQVRKGEIVPIDGCLLSEIGLFDQSMVTGEPLAAEKISGDDVIGGTINQGETVEMLVTTKAGETVFDQIIRLVENAEKNQSRTATLIERLEDTYVKIVLILVPSFILFAYLVLGWDLMEAFYRGMILLTVASPCALVASSTPANLSAISRAAQKGVMIKGGDIADRLGEIKVLVTDKTGTLTKGKPYLTTSYYLGDKNLIQSLLKTAEQGSNHPIANAFLEAYQQVPILELEDIQDITGQGLKVIYQDKTWKIGKPDFACSELKEPLSQEILRDMADLQEQGKMIITMSCDGVLQAYFGLEDEIKKEAYQTLTELRDLGIETVMVTGDQKNTANHIARRLGIDKVYANCMPEDKARILTELEQTYGMVGMVGDGINDAPALATAGVSFAIGEGTDIAIESADVVVMEDLRHIPFVIRLSHQMRRIVMTNLLFSIAVIACLILANVFKGISLPLGVVGHEGSTILVILNGLRLLVFEKHVKQTLSSKAVHLPCPNSCYLLENRV